MDIKVFSSPQFGEIRTATDHGQSPLFCATDVAKALGYSNTRDAIAKHVEIEDVAKRDTLTSGGVQEMTYINESGLYSLIFGSKLDTAKQFKRWVTSEVLPAIRQTGGYIATRDGDTDEVIMARALLVAQATIERKQKTIEQQKDIIVAQGHAIIAKDKAISHMLQRVSYLDKVLASESTISTTQIAADYGMTARKFNRFLHSLKIQRKVGGQWILYAPYLNEGYTHSETFVQKRDGKVKMITKWTQKGRLFIYERMKRVGILPIIERQR